MRNNQKRHRATLADLSGFLLLFFIVLACNISSDRDAPKGAGDTPEAVGKKPDSKQGGGKIEKKRTDQAAQEDANNPRVEICRRYEECGCQSYESCLEQLENDSTPDEAGIKECILNSSCQSLCAGKPDGCPNRKTDSPRKSNCAAVSCSKNSDCPGDCHGGCDGVRCYSF